MNTLTTTATVSRNRNTERLLAIRTQLNLGHVQAAHLELSDLLRSGELDLNTPLGLAVMRAVNYIDNDMIRDASACVFEAIIKFT